MATTEKETPSKKAAAPSVSQINAEYVTQVNLYLHTARCFCLKHSLLLETTLQCSQNGIAVVCLNVYIHPYTFLPCAVSVGKRILGPSLKEQTSL